MKSINSNFYSLYSNEFRSVMAYHTRIAYKESYFGFMYGSARSKAVILDCFSMLIMGNEL